MGKSKGARDSGAIDAVGPEEIAKSFEMNETEMSRRAIGQIAANGSSIKNDGAQNIVETTENMRV